MGSHRAYLEGGGSMKRYAPGGALSQTIRVLIPDGAVPRVEAHGLESLLRSVRHLELLDSRSNFFHDDHKQRIFFPFTERAREKKKMGEGSVKNWFLCVREYARASDV